jgi:hypothetical protein
LACNGAGSCLAASGQSCVQNSSCASNNCSFFVCQ